MQRQAGLLPDKAAAIAGVPPELLRAIVGPQGQPRSSDEIALGQHGFVPERQQDLQDLLQKLQAPPTSRLTRVLMPKMGSKASSRLFIVSSGPSGLNTSIEHRLQRVYAHSKALVRPPRSFKAEPMRQSLRWLSTVLKAQIPQAMEIQTYFDRRSNEVWVSSNSRTDNKRIQQFLAADGLDQLLSGPRPKDHAQRKGRHETKLRQLMSEAPPERPMPQELKELVAAVKSHRFRVPDEKILDGRFEIHLHAERRIKRAFEQESGHALELSSLAGTMRPCAICADELGVAANAPRGPFWLSRPAGAFKDVDEVAERYIDQSITTNATRTRDGKLTIAHDTDSDSDR